MLTEVLAARSRDDILAYKRCFTELSDAAYRWDAWAAAYLIGGGCSDDSFIDFRAGLTLQGRDWYERALVNPDNLAEHPALASPDDAEAEVLFFCEEINCAARRAFARSVGTSEDFYDA
ncbi:DUF4240 domain-containing protein [Yinghuangia soli]|uniref:DUF4240 domain-containing protein n=1 Tax=Yinghuangia soli TaxID=2908204 RepID=A0AA41U9M0_9ACTN|nr:DUF4240 domain-containing protein [Yinghuangia soli]MCF2533984.1 DUF4240 domain-containing protein [Yinghuangia soli]